ncbi:putative cell surface spherulin 4-like protein [Diaporthe ampelina]|uniref:Putative cell surface spherulin 4-like protein n=1 Tax=Diaporthe ampelina TaxID=1214573 RepID=A0A0G2FN01_9PEZI|nr:putative cell surface spherulin 4-like protein [Diaporthe ampelina]
MQSLYLFSALLAATTASATRILLPLYVYPSPGTAWNSIYNAIETHPSIDFSIIINPSSGPGGSTPGYNSHWITAVSKLHTYDNVDALGYVRVGYGAKALTDITADISNWDAWNHYTEADITIDGIFFDETPNWQGTKGANDVSFMQQLAQLADHGGYSKVFNLGQASNHDEYFHIADMVIIFENTAEAYNNTVLNKVVADGVTGKSAVLLHHFEGSSLTSGFAVRWLMDMVNKGLGSFAIVNTDWTHSNSDAAPMGIGILADMLESVLGH